MLLDFSIFVNRITHIWLDILFIFWCDAETCLHNTMKMIFFADYLNSVRMILQEGLLRCLITSGESYKWTSVDQESWPSWVAVFQTLLRTFFLHCRTFFLNSYMVATHGPLINILIRNSVKKWYIGMIETEYTGRIILKGYGCLFVWIRTSFVLEHVAKTHIHRIIHRHSHPSSHI